MNITYTLSDDYSEATASRACVHCEEGFTETVSTTYLNGFVSADFLSEYFEDQLLAPVATSQELLNAVDNAEIISTTQNPATIRLMKNIEVEAKVDAYYAILIETGTIIIDLNGYTLSALNNLDSMIGIGANWGELCDATVIINDSSINQSGKILASTYGIDNNGGNVILNAGTIKVNNTKELSVTVGINFYLGSVTINGGSILVTSVCEYRMSSGIGEEGTGGIFTMNGGYINVNSPSAEALSLRTAYINGGTIESNKLHISGSPSYSKNYLGTNEDGVGATFVGGIKSWLTLNSLLTEGVGYYGADGKLIEINDEVVNILNKGDITIKRID